MALVVFCSVAAADDAVPDRANADGTDRAREFLELAHQEAAAYELRCEADGTLLEPLEDPVLQWSNPVVGEIYGGVFLWTRQGRPEAAAAIFKWYSPFTHMTHEFQSLSTDHLTVDRNGRAVWSTTRAGIELKEIPEAPAPVATRAGRLRQMRQLVRRFSASMDHHEQGMHNLRLLTQPLYLYEDGASESGDGALFAYVLGTDPEVLLLIESRRTPDGPEAWHYAPARMNFERLRVTYDGEEVWDVPRLLSRDIYHGSEPYRKFQFKESPAAENE